MKKKLFGVIFLVALMMMSLTSVVFADINTIADVLNTVEGVFPTTEETGWVNEEDKKMYLDGEELKYYDGFIYNWYKVSQKDNSYTYLSGKFIFNMESGKLVSIEITDDNLPNSKGIYVPQHIHNFTYEAQNNIITAKCSKDGCPLTDNKLTLTLTAPESLAYTGSPIEIGFGNGEADAWTNAGLELPIISYTAKDGSQLTDNKAVDAGSYIATITVDTDKTATLEFEIIKATPWIKTPPAPSDIDYGKKLSDSTLSGWSVQVSENNTNQIGGLFEWASGDIVPSVIDSERTLYSVTFTPADEKNYNKVACKVTIKINNVEITIADALATVDGGFPTTSETGWLSENDRSIYGYNDYLWLDNNDFSIYFSINNEIAPCTDGYFCRIDCGQADNFPPDTFVVCIFVFEDNKLVEIKIDDANMNLEPFKGTYIQKFETVTFDMKGHGTQIESKIIPRGTTVTKPIEPTADGFVFEGWYDNENYSGNTFDFETPITDNLTLFAKWRQKTISPSKGGSSSSKATIKFDTNGGNDMKNISVKKGQKIGTIENPQKGGFIFDCWYKDKECTKPYDVNEKVTSTTTLYAGWKVDPARQITLKIGQKEAMVLGEQKANDVAPIIRSDRTMLPARFVAEALGAKVEWIGEERKVLISKDNVEIIIYIDSEVAYVNGEKVILDSPAFIENDRTYTPIRFISERLNAEVEWIEETKEVVITKNI